MVALRASILANRKQEQLKSAVQEVHRFDAQVSAVLARRGLGLGPREESVLVQDEESGWWYWYDPASGNTRWGTPGEVRRVERQGASGNLGAGKALSDDEVGAIRREADQARRNSRKQRTVGPGNTNETLNDEGEGAVEMRRRRRREARRAKVASKASMQRESDGTAAAGRLQDSDDLARRMRHEARVAEAVEVLGVDPRELDVTRI